MTEVAETQELSGTPSSFCLQQNYPNPFNPVTTIGYRVPGVGSLNPRPGTQNPDLDTRNPQPGTRSVKLAVYDLLGREVAVLLNELRGPGNYTAQFDASGLASGTYFYRMQITGDGYSLSETKRMMLVR
jgi:hypothetical protein